jgi:hypothetical protein
VDFLLTFGAIDYVNKESVNSSIYFKFFKNGLFTLFYFRLDLIIIINTFAGVASPRVNSYYNIEIFATGIRV